MYSNLVIVSCIDELMISRLHVTIIECEIKAHTDEAALNAQNGCVVYV